MIRIEIEADTAAAAMREVIALATAMTITVSGTQPSETPATDDTKPAPKKAPAKKDVPAEGKPDTPAETAAPTPEKAAAKPSATEASPEAGEVDVTDKASVKNFMSIGIDNLGVQTVSEVMAELGAKKFGDISADKYPALVTRLDDLMKAKGKE